VNEIDYAPDASPLTPGVLTSVSDFVPLVSGSYGIGAGTVTESYSAPLASSDVIGSALVKNKAGTVILYAGTTGKLYQATGTTGWTDRSAKAYSTASTGTWEFVQFGDTTYAANGADTLQKASGGAFADVATAPIARTIISHENALIALNLSTDTAGWARSDTGSDTFTVTAANDADSGTFLQGSGPITAGTTFGSLAIAFKGDWMYGGRFVGDIDEKVRWDTIDRVGCVGQHAHISTENGLIFVSNRDILLFDGSAPRSIADKVRRAFFQQINPAQRANIWITHDEVDRIIYIWYPVVNSGQNYPTRALAYNYHTGKWGSFNSISSAFVTYDYVRCPVRGANYTDYITVGSGIISTNSKLSVNAVFASASSTGKLVNYPRSSGATRSGTPSMTTAFMGQPNKDSRLTRLYLVADGNTGNAHPTSASVTTYNSAFDLTTAVTKTWAVSGRDTVDGLSDGRFHQATISWPAANATNTEIAAMVPVIVPTSGGR
jgi:hypothetical protein